MYPSTYVQVKTLMEKGTAREASIETSRLGAIEGDSKRFSTLLPFLFYFKGSEVDFFMYHFLFFLN